MVETTPKPVHIYIGDHGRILATRPRGAQAATQVRELAQVPGDMIIDFREVELATPPFLQEVVDAAQSVLLANRETGRIIVFAHMNEDVSETLGYVAAKKRLSLAYQYDDAVDLTEASPQVAETLREAQRLRTFTSPELADKLEIAPDAATQRLRKLLMTGAAVREPDPSARQGVRHIYRVATPDLVREATSPVTAA
jgi:hypothetical protein